MKLNIQKIGAVLALCSYVVNTLISLGVWWSVVADGQRFAAYWTLVAECTGWLLLNVLLGVAVLFDDER